MIGDELWNSMKARDCLARSCRLDKAAWLPVMAADDTFQPESAEDLLRRAQDYLCNPQQGFRKAYACPLRVNSAIAKTLWGDIDRCGKQSKLVRRDH